MATTEKKEPLKDSLDNPQQQQQSDEISVNVDDSHERETIDVVIATPNEKLKKKNKRKKKKKGGLESTNLESDLITNEILPAIPAIPSFSLSTDYTSNGQEQSAVGNDIDLIGHDNDDDDDVDGVDDEHLDKITAECYNITNQMILNNLATLSLNGGVGGAGRASSGTSPSSSSIKSSMKSMGTGPSSSSSSSSSSQQHSGSSSINLTNQKSVEFIKPLPKAMVQNNFNDVLETVRHLDGMCAYRRCRTRVIYVGDDCRVCTQRFCFTHSLPEIHGCGEAMRHLERNAFIHPPPRPACHLSHNERDESRRAQNRLADKLERMGKNRKKKVVIVKGKNKVVE